MKKIFLLLLIAASCIIKGKAQSGKVVAINKTNCEVVVTAYCYDLCSVGITYGPYVLAPSGGNQPIPDCPQSSAISTIYKVCWNDPNCANVCVYVLGPGNGSTCGLTLGSMLNACGDCKAAKVSYSGGQLLIQ
ncbi:MAG: hypothetical protein JST52_06985 [Bacteroidetes bacterium]|nr:hypothetical protein [Bacteroidota bacterium]MBS1740023.1 hypothetical protein [Bacteroidota bacterium]